MRALPVVALSLFILSSSLAADDAKPSPAHVVYLVDTSGSMILVWPDAVDQIVKSFDSLKDGQTFAVILITDAKPVMIGNGLMIPNEGNKKMVAEVLWKYQCHGNDRPIDAMAVAVKLKPDLVWYVSDGDIETPDNTIDEFRRAATHISSKAPTFPINTIAAFAGKNEKHLDVLRAVADKTGGVCVGGDVKPTAEKEKPATRPSGPSIFDK